MCACVSICRHPAGRGVEGGEVLRAVYTPRPHRHFRLFSFFCCCGPLTASLQPEQHSFYTAAPQHVVLSVASWRLAMQSARQDGGLAGRNVCVCVCVSVCVCLCCKARKGGAYSFSSSAILRMLLVVRMARALDTSYKATHNSLSTPSSTSQHLLLALRVVHACVRLHV